MITIITLNLEGSRQSTKVTVNLQHTTLTVCLPLPSKLHDNNQTQFQQYINCNHLFSDNTFHEKWEINNTTLIFIYSRPGGGVKSDPLHTNPKINPTNHKTYYFSGEHLPEKWEINNIMIIFIYSRPCGGVKSDPLLTSPTMNPTNQRTFHLSVKTLQKKW